MKGRLVLFVIAFIVWGLLRFPLDMQHIGVGLVVALVVAILAGDLFTQRPRLFLEPKRYFWFICYIFVFCWEWLKANISITLRLVLPSVPLNPAIIEIETALKTEIALTFLANTLTLTLGTISIDVDNKTNTIYLHCLQAQDGKTLDKRSRVALERFEAILKNIFE